MTNMFWQCVCIAILSLLVGCGASTRHQSSSESDESGSPEPAQPDWPQTLWVGADLSYINEMEDCGVTYRDQNGVRDPFELFYDAGANLVRVRLWHNAEWTNYSDMEDVKKTLRRAKSAGMAGLLDFHYSDTWADPERQIIPAAWSHMVTDRVALGQAVYDYTYQTLLTLHAEALVPEMVQIGNEINNEVLQPADDPAKSDIDWGRNTYLINQGLAAIDDFNRDYNESVSKMIHIAQPENALVWFSEASRQGLTNYDLIGISYYPKWSTWHPDNVGEAIRQLKEIIGKPTLVVETAYPWTLNNYDQATNVLGADSLIDDFPASLSGQSDYLMRLGQSVVRAGGLGIVYWEPAWLSSECATQWGQGSHWENAGFFDPGNANLANDNLHFFQRLRDWFTQQIQ